jgi:hypothetical protein
MAQQLNFSQKECSVSWVRKYFRMENRFVNNVKTGFELPIKYDVCVLPNPLNLSLACEKAYVHNLKNGTKNLIRHIVSEHRQDVSVKMDNAVNKVDLSKVFSIINSRLFLAV